MVPKFGLEKFLLLFQKIIKIFYYLKYCILSTCQIGLKYICKLLEVQQEYSLLEDLKRINTLSKLKLYTIVLVYGHDSCKSLFATGSSIWKHHKKDYRFKSKQISLI